MSETITTREAIATAADRAAAKWVADPSQPRPANPYLADWFPDHHQAWAAAFERALVKHSAPEAESSA